LRGGIDKLLAQVVRGFALGAQAHPSLARDATRIIEWRQAR
jgi:hypothetical protein